MSVSGNYDKVSYIASGKSIRAQSIVECRLNDWGENRVLAVSARAVSVGAETLSGEVRYGGRLYFTVLACTPDGSIVSGERGAEFSHRAECESAAPAQTADVTLTVEKVEVRRDGRALVLSAIVSADVSLFVPAEISYLSGGDGVVCDFRPVRLLQVAACRGEAEIEEEFDTDYVGDVLAHCETAFVNRVTASAGSVEVSGEINLGILAKREGESDTVSFERLIPFRAEIPCDEAFSGCGCTAEACVREVNISAACDEDKNRCRVAAEFTLALTGRVYRGESVHMSADAFCPGFESSLERAEIVSREPVAAFSATERVSGTAAISEPVDFACTLQSVAFGGCLAAAAVSDGEVNVEGVVSAYILMKDGEGNPKSCEASLPFSFPVKCDRAKKGQSANVSALACGISARQKKEGELEAECALKLYITLFECQSSSAVTRIEAGDAVPECDAAVSVYIPCAGDGLWDIAKRLKRSPEEVRRTNASLEFPLGGGERIVVYRRKEIGF